MSVESTPNDETTAVHRSGLRGWFQKLGQKWGDWFGDHELEMDIRKHLDRNGYFGRSAKFSRCHLVAIQRPGWIQVHAFNVIAKPGSPEESEPRRPEFRRPEGPSPEKPMIELFGLAKDDGRTRSEVELFESAEEREARFSQWMKDPKFIVKRRVDWSR